MRGYAIKLLGLSAGIPSEHDGKYVVYYDPTGAQDNGFIILHSTDQIDEAQQFSTFADAIRLWRTRVGTRLDGQPDRPLTVYDVEITPVEIGVR